MTLLFGKYRGEVKANQDPMLLGRLRVTAPQALGDAEVWALPCAPFAGKGVGFFALPPEGANVWVEFEGGNIEAPIWSGCFWDAQGRPPGTGFAPMKVIKTDAVTITLSDLPGAGGISIETADGKKIVLNAAGIEINDGVNGTIKLTGPTISLNDGALEVT